MSPRPALVLSLFAALAAASGCDGKIGDAHGSGGSSGTIMPDAQGNLPYVAPTPVAAALPARAWRLTHAEYRKSVKDLTGVDVDTSVFEPEADGGLFVNLSNTNFVRVNLAANYQDAAEQVADTMTDAQLRALAPACTTLAAACKTDFIRGVLTRAYRRPPSAEEITEAGQVFDARRRHRARRGVPVPRRGAGGADVAVLPLPHRDRRRRERRAAELPHHRPRGRVVSFVQRARPGAVRGAAGGRRSGRADERGDVEDQRRCAAGDARGGRSRCARSCSSG